MKVDKLLKAIRNIEWASVVPCLEIEHQFKAFLSTNRNIRIIASDHNSAKSIAHPRNIVSLGSTRTEGMTGVFLYHSSAIKLLANTLTELDSANAKLTTAADEMRRVLGKFKNDLYIVGPEWFEAQEAIQAYDKTKEAK